MEKILYVMRGLPWTGKSFRAKQILEQHADQGQNGFIFSTDEYFYKIRHPDEPEKYSFHPHFLGDAHRWNQQRADRKIEMGDSPIIIDNTIVRPNEAKHYVEYALPQDYVVRIEEPTSDRWLEIRELLQNKETKEANRDKLKSWSLTLAEGSKETHSVPAWAIERMMWRWWSNLSIEDILKSEPIPTF